MIRSFFPAPPPIFSIAHLLHWSRLSGLADRSQALLLLRPRESTGVEGQCSRARASFLRRANTSTIEDT